MIDVQVFRERVDQPRPRALTVADRKARQREQRIAPLNALRRLAEGMETVADLRLL